ncbi:SIR2 family NAD-dependent protein deacylase [Blautia sp. MSJ-36]|uniref:SIR2 family NAD-dependent protein deacylase n=1 Tax=Blautia sp. MSJ-36 TaxID=2841530 RepID=UPI001C1146A8|nr:Sir2 family NAD-dependent protein deacetylase [Blautia sp. MSJ-36]MBU5446525.1 Sir2 silent information regulator family NAD-dependent deacetylase [Blautia sp. MSJ-36]
MEIQKRLRIRRRKKVDWTQFLCGIPSRDYVFQQGPYEEQIRSAARYLQEADYVLIGAGAGLSTAAGLTYSGKRFQDNFKEFIEKYGMQDMYSAGFYPFGTEEERWAYWCRHSYVNRIEPPAMPLYEQLFAMVKDKDYFVLTTNVDHQFQKAGFQDKRIFATQGDYGLIQCMKGCHPKTYDAVSMFTQMNQAQKDCKIPSYMVPRCPVCGGPMAMNLRCDQYFVEDEAWNQAAENYGRYLKQLKKGNVLFLELGVGFNTPSIIRFPFEKMVRENKNINLVRLNLDEAVIPESFGKRGIGINRDLCESLDDIRKNM